MNIVKKIFLRLLKNIEIYTPQNIQFGKGSTLSNGSILNARKGKIILGQHTRIGNSSEIVAAKNKTVEIKDYTTLYSNCKILGSVTIERYGVLATNIYMSSGNHFAFEYPELLIKKRQMEQVLNRAIRGELFICHPNCLSDELVGHGARTLQIWRLCAVWRSAYPDYLGCIYIASAHGV